MIKVVNHYLSWIDSDKELHCELLQPEEKSLSVGRTNTADIEILNTSVSRKHIELSWHNNQLHIKDLNSSFGTWVDNVRLLSSENKILESDSEIRLGNLSMWYEMRNADESQEMMQTCFHTPNANEEVELSSEINKFRVKLQSLLKDSFDDNTHNVDLINTINDDLLQLVGTQERRLKEQRILNSISHVLNRSLTLPELLKTSLNLVSKVLNADRGFVILRNTQNNQNEIMAKRNFDDIKWQEENDIQQKFSHKLVQQCLSHNKILIIGDTNVNNIIDDIVPIQEGSGRSIVVIPLMQDANVIGVIYLDNQQQAHNFDKHQIPFLTTYAAHTSIALHNVLLFKLAITDDLTQLHTRQYIDEGLNKEMRRSRLDDSNLSVLLLDLDHFKQVNDNYGHTTGDHVLQEFSNIIRTHLRHDDMAGRFGGEEFVIILPKTDHYEAKLIAENIRKTTEQFRFEKDETSLQCTVSIGIASYQLHHGQKVILLLEDADKALYQAKENGRNQSVVFND
ncbi:MAG: diguanylate cyclase [Marinicellaceae bacterium]